MARAKALLAEPTSKNLRYAALELRLCIELLTYEKLRSFSSVIPESVLSTWQPPQAVKALLEFEPSADRSFTLFAGLEEEYGKPSNDMKFVGKHNAIPLKWLRRHYNKLGSLLHAPPPASSGGMSQAETKTYLEQCVSELEEPLSGNITGFSLRNVVSIPCDVCESPVMANAEVATSSHKAVCLNPKCSAEYFVDARPDGEIAFRLKATVFNCAVESCSGNMPIENRKLDIGAELICPECKSKHRIVSRQWGYELPGG